jgi:hypothetical protein
VPVGVYVYRILKRTARRKLSERYSNVAVEYLGDTGEHKM